MFNWLPSPLPGDKESASTANSLSLVFQSKRGFILLAFVAVFFLLQYGSITSKSGTFDEPMHLTAGYLALKEHDFRIDSTHPPFLRMWAATPLLFQKDVKADVALVHSWPQQNYVFESYRYASKFTYPGTGDEARLVGGRLMMATWGAVLGILVFCWCFEWFGYWPAALALGAFLVEPNLSGHAGLITTDMGAACFYFGSVYFLWRTLRAFTSLNVVLTAVSFSLANVSKFSAVLLVPIFIILTAYAVWQRRLKIRQAALLTFLTIVICYTTIWACYAFRYQPSPHSSYLWNPDTYLQDPLPKDWLSSVCNFFDRYHLLPNAFIQGFAISIKHAQVVPSYFDGQINNTGWWYYFPLAYLMKTPAAFLLLAGWAVIRLVRYRTEAGTTTLLTISLAVFVYAGAAIHSQINIGLRHILPLYPFLLLASGVVIWRPPSVTTTSHNRLRYGMVLMLFTWWAVTFSLIYPNTLTFFNRFIGGPETGRRFLTDSNLDWGQHLKPLKKWMDEKGLSEINLAYFGTADPEFYGIKRRRLMGNLSVSTKSEARPQLPGYVAISETLLSGVYWSTEARMFYAGFKGMKPVTSIGNTIRIYWVERWPVPSPGAPNFPRRIKVSNLVTLGDNMVRIDWPEQAMIYFRLAETLDPRSSPIHARIGTLHLRLGNRDAAIESYRHAVAYAPANAKYTGMLASLLVEAARYDEAEPLVKKWQELAPASADARYCMATIHASRHDYSAARFEIIAALARDPKNPQLKEKLFLLNELLGLR